MRATGTGGLDPQALRLLTRVEAAGLPDFHRLDPMQARALFRETAKRVQGKPVQVLSVKECSADGIVPVPIRLYRPMPAPLIPPSMALPCLIYFHGGGWTVGDLDTHDCLCRMLADFGRCAVAAVDYRLAPEHKFPAGLEDALAATQWIARNAHSLGLDPTRLAIGGDSAGGNLAAVIALTVRGSDVRLVRQLLLYPATDMSMQTPSAMQFAEGYLLTRSAMHWFRDNYVRSSDDWNDWRASPMRAQDLSGLPPAHVVIAGHDPLRDDGQRYADHLMAAGVEVSCEVFEGMIHGFASMTGVFAAAPHALHRCGNDLQEAFGLTNRQLRDRQRDEAPGA